MPRTRILGDDEGLALDPPLGRNLGQLEMLARRGGKHKEVQVVDPPPPNRAAPVDARDDGERQPHAAEYASAI